MLVVAVWFVCCPQREQKLPFRTLIIIATMHPTRKNTGRGGHRVVSHGQASSRGRMRGSFRARFVEDRRQKIRREAYSAFISLGAGCVDPVILSMRPPALFDPCPLMNV